MKKMFCILLSCMMLASCSTVTVKPKGTKKYSSEPTYKKRFNHLLWGLVGGGTVNVREACNGGYPKQMQTQRTFVDGLLAFVTAGIYFPRTAKVWCGSKRSKKMKKKS